MVLVTVHNELQSVISPLVSSNEVVTISETTSVAAKKRAAYVNISAKHKANVAGKVQTCHHHLQLSKVAVHTLPALQAKFLPMKF